MGKAAENKTPLPDTTGTCIHSRLDASLTHAACLAEYTPTIWDRFSVGLLVDGAYHEVKFIDTSGAGWMGRQRRQLYEERIQVDLVLLCFSVVDPVSFANVTEKW